MIIRLLSKDINIKYKRNEEGRGISKIQERKIGGEKGGSALRVRTNESWP